MRFEREQIAPSKVRAGSQNIKRRRNNTAAWSFRGDPLALFLASSIVIHASVILIVSSGLQPTALRPQNYFPVRLIEIQPPPAEEVAPPTPPAPKKEQPAPTLPARKAETPKAPTPAPKASIPKLEPPAPPVKTELPPELKAIAPKQPESVPQSGTGNSAEAGGSPAGMESLSAGREVGVAAGPGTGGGAGGSGAIGPGRGAGPPGPGTQTVLRTNREAKPIQTARATYPTMALRAGLESDVLLRIEVDPRGNVTKAEIVKSGGAGFDEEALRAVKQSRFEPAQRDGQNVAAEFTYVYRFRLQR
jgi:protein TonB